MAKSPGAVKLDEILDALKEQKLDIPPQIQEALKQAESDKLKGQKPKAEVTAGAPIQPKLDAQPKKAIKKQSKIARVILRRLIGDQWAKKLIKPEKITTQEVTRENTMRGDIKRIKQDVMEIKAHLKLVGSNGQRRTIGARVRNVFFGGKTREQTFGKKDLRMIKLPGTPRSMIKAPSIKPMITNPLPGMRRVKTEEIPDAIDNAQRMVQEDRAAQQKADAKVQHEDIGREDQAAVLKKNEQVHEDQEHQKTNDKLDAIDKELKEMKKGQSGLLSALLIGASALFKKLLGGAMGFLKNILKSIGKLGEWLFKKIPSILTWLKNIGTGTMGLLKKGGALVAELGVEGAGLLGATAIMGTGLVKMATLGDRAAAKTRNMLDDYGIKVPRAGHYVVNGKKYHAPGEPALSDDEQEAPEVVQKLVETANLKSVDLKDNFQIEQHQKWLEAHKDQVNAMRVPEPKTESLIPKKDSDDTANLSREDRDMGQYLKDLQAERDENQPPSMPPMINVTAPVAPVVTPAASKPAAGGSVAVIMTRNPEPTLARLTSSIFDDPSGWSGLSRV